MPALNFGVLEALIVMVSPVCGFLPSLAARSDVSKVGDVIEIQFGTRNVKAEVLSIQESQKKEAAAEMYRYI